MFIAGVEIVLEELCETEHLLSFPDKPASGWTTAGNFQFILSCIQRGGGNTPVRGAQHLLSFPVLK